jgi:ParB family chromosome partitioning protein
MKGVEKLKASFGQNIAESIGQSKEGAAGPLPPPLHGATSGRAAGVARSKDALLIAVDKLQPDPNQPRREFDALELEQLAASLLARGQLQPIRVRWDDARETWVIIAGERRWRAAVQAGLPSLACIEAKGPQSADDVLEDQLVENALRQDLRPLEQAHAFRALMERRGYSGRELAERLNLSTATVTRALALLELPESVQRSVEQGTLAPSVAYEVAKLDDPTAQAEVAEAAVAHGLTRCEVTETVQAIKAKRRPPTARPEPVCYDLGDGLTVTVRWKKANATSAVQALHRATKMAKEQARPEQAA